MKTILLVPHSKLDTVKKKNYYIFYYATKASALNDLGKFLTYEDAALNHQFRHAILIIIKNEKKVFRII